MGMLDRIKKKQLNGFREFVQNMEITGSVNRQQIFMTGVLEDPVFMSYVMKNLRTFNDFMNLPSEDVDAVLNFQEQVLGIFAKCMFGQPPEKLMELESLIPRLMSRFKDELSYLGEVTPAEVEAAKYFMVKTARKLQMEEKIIGFHWNYPPLDLFYPKTFNEGPCQIKFETGLVAAEGTIDRGKRSGAWKHFYDTGKILAEGDYSEGLKTGVWVFYYGNGSIKSQGKYRGDLKQGMWKEWDRSGAMTENEYLEGVKKTS